MRMKRLPAFTLGILAMIGMTEARSSVDDEKAVAALDTEYQAAVKNNDVPTMHRGHIVVFYSRLILRIECSDGFFVIYGRSSLSHSNHRKYPQRKSREALHPHQNFLRGVLPSSASCRSTHVWISSRSPNSDRSFAACRSALASSRQP